MNEEIKIYINKKLEKNILSFENFWGDEILGNSKIICKAEIESLVESTVNEFEFESKTEIITVNLSVSKIFSEKDNVCYILDILKVPTIKYKKDN